MISDWRQANRSIWDERIPAHVRPDFYDVNAFRAGRPIIQSFEVDELGALGDSDLVHLQCRSGLDTLDLARQHPTLKVTGLDLSAPAIEAAQSLAEEIGAARRARFVQAEVAGAVSVLGSAAFDVVYTGKGALNWLPDLREWASVVHGLLKPGGRLYLVEFHPVASVLGADSPEPVLDYFSTEPVVVERPPTYAFRDGPAVSLDANSQEKGLVYEWLHPLGSVVTALVRAGMAIRFLHEWPFTTWRPLPPLVPYGEGAWTWPGPGTLPLQYSLRADRP